MSQYTRLASNDDQESVIRTIERWAKRIGKPICGADLIGKYHDTVILDLSYHGSEIYVNANGWDDTDHGYPGVTVNDVHITGPDQFETFKAAALGTA